ncbi:MAG: GNAT family N-acetyltransferase [Clostridiales bacterium]|jgi:ribosomal protein S18 acetylase RimI-like enzyme|nr:GNAT family N-acetyltransferase [Clostridiales bacterium]
MQIVALSDEFRKETERFAAESWGGLRVAAHRELYCLRELPCYIALSDKREILGYSYYRFSTDECEIMAIESVRQNIGVGTALIKAVTELAVSENCRRLYLQTTNDNTHALRFYQRRGFTICAVRLNELEHLRKLKPAIPLTGIDGIALAHEIELEMLLAKPI